ncbi:hypothetical protein C0065_11050 [Klebsiella pneumoniae]|nr:hypothetical protein C0065_11050 [Klebsiella pneumoniae]
MNIKDNLRRLFSSSPITSVITNIERNWVKCEFVSPEYRCFSGVIGANKKKDIIKLNLNTLRPDTSYILDIYT